MLQAVTRAVVTAIAAIIVILRIVLSLKYAKSALLGGQASACSYRPDVAPRRFLYRVYRAAAARTIKAMCGPQVPATQPAWSGVALNIYQRLRMVMGIRLIAQVSIVTSFGRRCHRAQRIARAPLTVGLLHRIVHRRPRSPAGQAQSPRLRSQRSLARQMIPHIGVGIRASQPPLQPERAAKMGSPAFAPDTSPILRRLLQNLPRAAAAVITPQRYIECLTWKARSVRLEGQPHCVRDIADRPVVAG
jgi:hypothetical protein